MSNYAEGREAFRDAVRRAEEAAAAEETPSLPELLKDAVPVQASDQPLTPAEPAPADTPVEPEQTPAVLETEEQLRERLVQAEARLADKDSFIGRQSSEVGELRTVVDQLAAQLAAVQASTIYPAPVPVSITQQLIDEDPARATLLAFEQKNEQALAIAFDAWKVEDPFTAGSWLAEERMKQRESALREEIQGVKTEMQTLSQPQQEAAERQQWSDAFALVSQNHPDFVQNAARILEDVAPNYPAILGTLANGDAKAKAEILTALYAIDRSGNTDPVKLAAQVKEETDRAAEESRLAREGALVVTQANAGLGSAVELSDEQKEQEAYKSRIGGGVSLERGWTGRTPGS